MATVETDLARGDLPDPNQDRVRFGDFAGTWLAAKTDVRESTQELYEYQLRLHILPYFADVAVGRIDAAAIRSWHAELIASSGMSKTSVAKVYRLMRQILAAAAVDDRLLRENPCRGRHRTISRTRDPRPRYRRGCPRRHGPPVRRPCLARRVRWPTPRRMPRIDPSPPRPRFRPSHRAR
ncbi:MAG: hypothetical protein GY929_09130 [Actinomycetia bacterium]|nr:hypothetical protein [Actinomycetes bacterium]